jgi:NAD(P)-dependent dehydrogenase (short-subunit alcohol dehydrogenase family)
VGAQGIRVNAIAPGHIETPLTAYLKDPAIKQGRADVTPLGRVGQVATWSAEFCFYCPTRRNT